MKNQILGIEWITIVRFSELTGYTEAAVRQKIARGDWLEGQLWTRAPDNRILINLNGYHAWVRPREAGSPLKAIPA